MPKLLLGINSPNNAVWRDAAVFLQGGGQNAQGPYPGNGGCQVSRKFTLTGYHPYQVFVGAGGNVSTIRQNNQTLFYAPTYPTSVYRDWLGLVDQYYTVLDYITPETNYTRTTNSGTTYGELLTYYNTRAGAGVGGENINSYAYWGLSGNDRVRLYTSNGLAGPGLIPAHRSSFFDSVLLGAGGNPGIYATYSYTITGSSNVYYESLGFPSSAYPGAINTGNGATGSINGGYAGNGLGGSGVIYIKYPADYGELANITADYTTYTINEADGAGSPYIEKRIYKFTSSGGFEVPS
jgi:hypothetical protein